MASPEQARLLAARVEHVCRIIEAQTRLAERLTVYEAEALLPYQARAAERDERMVQALLALAALCEGSVRTVKVSCVQECVWRVTVDSIARGETPTTHEGESLLDALEVAHAYYEPKL